MKVKKFIEILNDHHLEQLVHFPTRERNTLNLIITSLPSQFLDIQSPDRLSDHDIVSGTLKIVGLNNICSVIIKTIVNIYIMSCETGSDSKHKAYI